MNKKWMGVAFAVAMFGLARAEAEVPQSLVYAVYDNVEGAQDAYKAMKESQWQGVIHIQAFSVISKDDNGRVRVHSTQKRGAKAGAIVGALVGAIGGPAGALAGAGAGGGLGFLTGNAIGIPREDVSAIKASLKPGTSALIAVVDEKWVIDLERSLHEARAKEVLSRRLAPENAQTNPPPSEENLQPTHQNSQPSPND